MKKLHMIGNAHLDPVWLWTWQEGFQENKASFKSALDRLEEYEDVVFTSSSAQLYVWIEKNDPQMFEKIKKRVKEGRWIICGGWWVQPDCNIPCGESFARHALLSQNYFQDKFGMIAKTGYNVDSFGHHGMLPQILKLSGMDNYVFMRPGPHEKGLPGRNFIWESDDGSRVQAFRLPFSYGTFGSLEAHIDACMSEFDPNIDDLMCFYGVGNHGGGPTIKNIETIKNIQQKYDEVEIIFQDPNSYFEEMKSKEYQLPVHHGDLQHHASGCYSVHSEIKRMNRRCENALLRAEKFSTFSASMGKSVYPDNFNTAWERVLFNQFHDILAGTSIAKAYDDSRNEQGEAMSIAARNENNALQAISFSINIEKEEGMLPIVVFNPHSWSVNQAVEIETGMFDNLCKGSKYKLIDFEGKTIPLQKIASDAKVNGRNRIVFKALVPALGYTTYRLYAIEENETESIRSSSSNVLENEFVRMKIDEKSGGIESIYDKGTDTQMCSGTAAVAAVMRDDSDTWSHGVTYFQELEGYFKPVSIKKTEDGCVRSSIRVISKYKSSTLVQTFTLYKDSRDIHVSARINWQEKFKCVKLQFPLNLEHYNAAYEIPFGSINKECSGEEEPMQKWMDLSGMKKGDKLICGLSILNDSKYSASVHGNTMEMTVLRSPVYAHHAPYLLEDEMDDYIFMDQGIQEFNYRMVPHIGTWKSAGIVQKAEELNQPCTAVIETYHEGDLPQKTETMNVNVPNVVVTSLKKAEKTDEYIIRFYEYFGTKTEVIIDLPIFGKTIKTLIGPNEIKTFAVSSLPESVPYEVNFLEWEKN